jgi:hypothetical protein
MIINFPAPPPGLPPFFTQFLQVLKDTFLTVVSKDQAVSSILLQAPNGKVYSITVSNTGTVTSTLNTGKDRP